jgi:hypothetical protein
MAYDLRPVNDIFALALRFILCDGQLSKRRYRMDEDKEIRATVVILESLRDRVKAVSKIEGRSFMRQAAIAMERGIKEIERQMQRSDK